LTTSTHEPAWRNPARAWGLLVLATLFGVGGFFLFRRSLEDYLLVLDQEAASPVVVNLLYGVLAVVGLAKGEVIFRRKVMARALARGRDAIGEGCSCDLPLAPFVMLSMVRPWKRSHAISSWVLIPLMVGLAFFFRFGLEAMGMSATTAALVRGPVYFGIALALAYAAALYLVALLRFVGWWMTDGKPETIPLPGQPDRPGACAAQSLPVLTPQS